MSVYGENGVDFIQIHMLVIILLYYIIIRRNGNVSASPDGAGLWFSAENLYACFVCLERYNRWNARTVAIE